MSWQLLKTSRWKPLLKTFCAQRMSRPHPKKKRLRRPRILAILVEITSKFCTECIEKDQDFLYAMFLFCFQVEPCRSLPKRSHFASWNVVAHSHPADIASCAVKTDQKRRRRAVTVYLLSFVLVQVVLLLLVAQVPPHPSDDLPDLPQLQVRVGRLHLVPYLAERTHGRRDANAHAQAGANKNNRTVNPERVALKGCVIKTRQVGNEGGKVQRYPKWW